MQLSVLITRPRPAADRLADVLRQRWGDQATLVISPVMQIQFLDVDLDLNGTQTLVFTSRTGVEAFVRLNLPCDLPCFVVGHATLSVAQRHGLDATFAGNDVAEICDFLTSKGNLGEVLHLHGRHVAGDVVGQLRASGFSAREQVIYDQQVQALTGKAKTMLDGTAPVVLPLFSRRSAQLFFSQAKITAPLLIAAMSENIAQAVPDGFASRLIIAENPDLAAMLDSLDQLREYAIELESAKRAQ